ncbi:hypothetical protein SDC9_100032 [bioreactor metagenome]|uniref:Uncharacterized protein n=1 Tax=bioreactor metagenome TaxID=1076179 RepID=A0A645AK07_9ZZZZ
MRKLRADVVDGGEHLREVRPSVVRRRRADGDETELRPFEAVFYFSGKGEASLALVPLDQFVEPRFVYRADPVPEFAYPLFVDIDAADGMSVLRETGAGDESDISRSNNTNFHLFISPFNS